MPARPLPAEQLTSNDGPELELLGSDPAAFDLRTRLGGNSVAIQPMAPLDAALQVRAVLLASACELQAPSRANLASVRIALPGIGSLYAASGSNARLSKAAALLEPCTHLSISTHEVAFEQDAAKRPLLNLPAPSEWAQGG